MPRIVNGTNQGIDWIKIQTSVVFKKEKFVIKYASCKELYIRNVRIEHDNGIIT